MEMNAFCWYAKMPCGEKINGSNSQSMKIVITNTEICAIAGLSNEIKDNIKPVGIEIKMIITSKRTVKNNV